VHGLIFVVAGGAAAGGVVAVFGCVGVGGIGVGVMSGLAASANALPTAGAAG